MNNSVFLVPLEFISMAKPFSTEVKKKRKEKQNKILYPVGTMYHGEVICMISFYYNICLVVSLQVVEVHD